MFGGARAARSALAGNGGQQADRGDQQTKVELYVAHFGNVLSRNRARIAWISGGSDLLGWNDACLPGSSWANSEGTDLRCFSRIECLFYRYFVIFFCQSRAEYFDHEVFLNVIRILFRLVLEPK